MFFMNLLVNQLNGVFKTPGDGNIVYGHSFLSEYVFYILYHDFVVIL